MRKLIVLTVLAAGVSAHAATTITVSNSVTVQQVKRFGISGISHYYYDRLLLKNLVWHNAGFEGLSFQSVIRCASGSASGCVDDNPNTQWPTGFWNCATYEFILGAAKGRAGTVGTFTTAPRDGVTGSTWAFGDSGTSVAAGDYFIARKYTPGGADQGWNVSAYNGASVATELSDLPPGTEGRQCIRLSAPTGTAQINSAFGTFGGMNFVVMNGHYEVSFKAKGVGGANTVAVTVGRGATTFVNRVLPLTTSWGTYTVGFDASEPANVAPGFVVLNFIESGSSVLLDDVSLVQTNGNPANTTAFRDVVVDTLTSFNPGILRAHCLDLGDSLDDLVGSPFAHRRNEYNVYATDKGTIPYGYYEFLELCEKVGAEPYIPTPIVLSDTEAANLIEYLAGPSTTPYGAKRAARGHPAPWTDVFSRIHIELGNESWNPVFRGGTMLAPDYGARGNDVFRIMRASPYFDAAKFNLILGVQATNPFNSRQTHNASTNHDMLGIAPYIATRIDDFATNEQLFGSLFAEASWWSSAAVGTPQAGPVRQMYDMINSTTRHVPMIVYEVNLHTTQGSITQDILDTFTPSIGAGLAVADHMLTMLREFNLRDQALFSLAGYRYTRDDQKTVLLWGITRDLGVTDRKRPQFLALKLVNEALAGDMVQTTASGDDPTWNEPLTNRIQLDNVHYVQSFAFSGATKRAVVVFNFHRTNSLDVNFAGPNAPSGNVTIKRLTSANLTDTNENAETIAVTTETATNFDPAATMTLPPFSMTVLLQDVPQSCALRKGDVNANGLVTAFDASMALQAVVGSTALNARQQCAADYNGNGAVTAFDASLILQCAVGANCSTVNCP